MRPSASYRDFDIRKILDAWKLDDIEDVLPDDISAAVSLSIVADAPMYHLGQIAVRMKGQLGQFQRYLEQEYAKANPELLPHKRFLEALSKVHAVVIKDSSDAMLNTEVHKREREVEDENALFYGATSSEQVTAESAANLDGPNKRVNTDQVRSSGFVGPVHEHTVADATNETSKQNNVNLEGNPKSLKDAGSQTNVGLKQSAPGSQSMSTSKSIAEQGHATTTERSEPTNASASAGNRTINTLTAQMVSALFAPNAHDNTLPPGYRWPDLPAGLVSGQALGVHDNRPGGAATAGARHGSLPFRPVRPSDNPTQTQGARPNQVAPPSLSPIRVDGQPLTRDQVHNQSQVRNQSRCNNQVQGQGTGSDQIQARPHERTRPQGQAQGQHPSLQQAQTSMPNEASNQLLGFPIRLGHLFCLGEPSTNERSISGLPVAQQLALMQMARDEVTANIQWIHLNRAIYEMRARSGVWGLRQPMNPQARGVQSAMQRTAAPMGTRTNLQTQTGGAQTIMRTYQRMQTGGVQTSMRPSQQMQNGGVQTKPHTGPQTQTGGVETGSRTGTIARAQNSGAQMAMRPGQQTSQHTSDVQTVQQPPAQDGGMEAEPRNKRD